MTDELEAILRLVEAGRLTPDEAAPLIAALSAPASGRSTGGSDPRQLRIRISEGGRQVVNLRVPLAVADAALRMVPGLRGEQAERVRSALGAGAIGPIITVDDPDGDGVLISLE